MKRIITALCLTLSLQGCAFVAGAAAGAAAIAVVYDQRTIQSTLKDTRQANKIADTLRKYKQMWAQSHIEVTVFDGVTLLTGQTPKREWRQLAGEVAKSSNNGTRVYNQISIEGPTSSLTRTSDSWITTKIRSLMLADTSLKSSTIKVITENGVVYLLGIVSQKQADIAVDIARRVSGVQKVIKIFTYTKSKPKQS